jgi:hypothetical protein
VLRFPIKVALMGTMLMAAITPPAITHAFAHGGGKPSFAGYGSDVVGALLGLKPRPGFDRDAFLGFSAEPASHVRRHASHERDSHRSHKAQPINAALKPHEAQRKTLLDQVPDPRPRENDISKVGAAPADPALDQFQAAPASIMEREAEETVAMEPIIRSADAAQNVPPPGIEPKGRIITGSLEALSAVMVMLVAALGLRRSRVIRSSTKDWSTLT